MNERAVVADARANTVTRTVLLVLVVLVVISGAMAVYWATRTPLTTPHTDLSKKGRPEGVLLNAFTGNKPFDIQTNAKGKWTVVVFSVLGGDYVGYKVGDSRYLSDVDASAYELGVQLTALKNLLGDSGALKNVQIWLVRLDPQLGATSSWERSPISQTCVKCLTAALSAAHTRDGPYGNYYSSVYRWLDGQWAPRNRNGNQTKAAWNVQFAPSYAILDPDGDVRSIADGMPTGEVYATIMTLMERPSTINRAAYEKDMPYEPKKKGWFQRFLSETISFIGSVLMVLFVIVTMRGWVNILSGR